MASLIRNPPIQRLTLKPMLLIVGAGVLAAFSALVFVRALDVSQAEGDRQ